ncbi:MAG: hypothetical protein ACRD9W_02340, partial [Terriglobia bacterium]
LWRLATSAVFLLDSALLMRAAIEGELYGNKSPRSLFRQFLCRNGVNPCPFIGPIGPLFRHPRAMLVFRNLILLEPKRPVGF